eukprot:TRINITY_DN12261_c1_g1_i1.p1 TRINITY_DN12261_c1_g1~~TRINITY_DN12261_c1_g1_i1.p1  ORF type:complete len:226 (+),score=60.77 TRINITY_DN12261_c1_g1_i1:150-827(+)
MVEAKHLHYAELALICLVFLLQVIAMGGSTAMWSSDGGAIVNNYRVLVNGCGLFECDGPPACGCIETGCNTDCKAHMVSRGCPASAQDAHCDDLSGHMAVAQAFAVVCIMFVVIGFFVAVMKVIPQGEMVTNLWCYKYCQGAFLIVSLCSLLSFALVAASYDQEFCGCAVKDAKNTQGQSLDSSLSYGFAFMVINFVLSIICFVLHGAAQAMEGSAQGDYNSYSS